MNIKICLCFEYSRGCIPHCFLTLVKACKSSADIAFLGLLYMIFVFSCFC